MRKEKKDEIQITINKKNLMKGLGIVVLVLGVLGLSFLASNSYGGGSNKTFEFTNITVDEYLSLMDADEKSIIYVARPDCSFCQKQKPILTKIASKYDLEVYYLNTSGFVDYDGHGKGAYPVGILIKDGEIIYDPGYSKYDIVGFDEADNLIVGTYTLEEIKELKIRDAVEPFYKLTVNGKNRISEGNGGYGLHPRTAIGQTAKGEVLLLVIDGRQLHSVGATMKDCQDILVSYGAINSAALDGGSSSIMYYDGAIQTKPSNGTTYGRYLPSAWVVYE